jgi:hypothetical protein
MGALSRQVHCKAFEIGERTVSQSSLMGRAQDDSRRLACLESFLPTWRTQAPPITGFEARKAEFRHRVRIERTRCAGIAAGCYGRAADRESPV